MGTISLKIDGADVRVEEGKTVLEAAEDNSIHIPTMCAHKDLSPYGACRLCIVEIEGVRGQPTSCTTPATEGMVVRTQTPELEKLRNQVLELMMSGHPNACLYCDHREDCEKHRPNSTKAGRTTRCGFCSNKKMCSLREMTIEAQHHELQLPNLYANYKLERSDPFIDRDHNLCVLCGRCWRICEKIHGNPAITITKRGRWAKVGTAFERSYIDSGCTFCGACIDICPTGTLTDRYARWYSESEPLGKTRCMLCPEGCEVETAISGKQVVGTKMTGFDREDRLCALGRFAYPQILNSSVRLRRAMIRENDELIPVEWDEAIGTVAEKFKGHVSNGFVAIVSESNTRENRHVVSKFATEVMKGRVATVPAGGGFDEMGPDSVKDDILAGKVSAALVTGDYLSAEVFEKIDCVVLADCLPSAIMEKVEAVLPVTVLSELDGTFRTAANEVVELGMSVPNPGDARAEWEIMGDLAKAMGSEACSYQAVASVTTEVAEDEAPKALGGSPRDTLKELPLRFRGHYVADSARALEAIGYPSTPPEEVPLTGEGHKVIEKREIVPNFHELVIEAPVVARNAKAGMFVILMVRETSERVPFTLIDWDGEKGTITLVVEEVGRSSREVAELRQGDLIAHVVGPLGIPYPIEKEGTVVLGGGCYGIGAMYSIARALREVGNKVICVLEASSHYLLYYQDKMAGVCDELLFVTKDGSRGKKGGIQDAFVELISNGQKVDRLVAIGCTFMMKMATEATRDKGVPLQVALNPIMVDGTGMCGACRVSVEGETKFACVDGPFFDGHDVDWGELASRRAAYARVEVEALPQHASSVCGNGHANGGCCGQHVL